MSKYKLPSDFRINNKISDSSIRIKPNDDYWSWNSSGKKYKIDWTVFDKNNFKLIIKLFILSRMKRLSIETVSNGDIRLLKEFEKYKISFPLEEKLIYKMLLNTSDSSNLFTFRKFYEFGLAISNENFTPEFNLKLKEFKVDSLNPYQKVFLQQHFVPDQEIEKIRNLILKKPKNDFISIRNNIIVQLAFELAPRPSQFYLLDKKDFKYINGNTKDYYSLNLPLTKKVKSSKIIKRERSITQKLGVKMAKYLQLNIFNNTVETALFITIKGQRLTSNDFTKIIKSELKNIGVDRTPTDLRHHLAQSLADQGASADIIAEIMGHNSTVPARAYIAATPKIADIKAKALAKNPRYDEIMKRLTGDFIDEKEVTDDDKIKGIVGNQYIGGIGKCGLPNDTSCPKNPVYSCYTCIKFHPFKNLNQHQKVKDELQKQAQFFIDISEHGNDLEYNRPVTQLTRTIEAVDSILSLVKNEK